MPKPKSAPPSLPYEGEKFINHLRVQRDASPHTLRAYREDLALFFKFLSSLNEIHPPPISHKNIQMFIDRQTELGYGKRTIRRRVSVLKEFFSYIKGIKEGYVQDEPVRLLKGPGISRKDQFPPFLTKLQVDELLEGPFESTRDRLVITWLYEEGLRTSELVRVNIDDVDLINKSLRIIGWKRKVRIIDLTKRAEIVFREYLQENKLVSGPLLLVQKSYRRATPREISRIANKYLSRIPEAPSTNPYVLRHSLAIHMLEEGVSLESICGFLGLKRRGIDIYIYIFKNFDTADETLPRRKADMFSLADEMPEAVREYLGYTSPRQIAWELHTQESTTEEEASLRDNEAVRIPVEVERFIIRLRNERRLSEGTLRIYRRALIELTRFISYFLPQRTLYTLSYSDIKAFKDSQMKIGVNFQMVQYRIKIIKEFFDFLHMVGKVKKNPVSNGVLKKANTPANQCPESFPQSFDHIKKLKETHKRAHPRARGY